MKAPREVSFEAKAILFDLDGVLVDSAECVERTWSEWSARREVDLRKVLEIAHGRRTIETLRAVAPHLATDAEVRELEGRAATIVEGLREIPGARELLGGLPPDAWAVVTSGTLAVAEFRLGHLGLPVPAVFVTADDISRGKPDPEGYLKAAARLAQEPRDCIVIEDAPAGIEAAHAGGMRAIGITSTYPRDRLSHADYVVGRLLDISIAREGGGFRILGTRCATNRQRQGPAGR
jgi:sugar-phosphatase